MERKKSINWLGLKEEPKIWQKGRMTNQMRALLEEYLMTGNAGKCNRYTAQDMQRELESVRRGGIDKNVLKITMIQN
ncbi:hypothetical protein C1646_750967 [Rhizophagus diaphanus]|nr:hypothetical protein C1646_750967 [Rhizophagus diaphanus] [Rhizophagus sp. MUCL 43196]